ncbi:C-type lectin lectoxin-Lio2-like [Alligator sinensis]|uniref:C-type lectin lectoxin-Lio2-like n=1 Tax=Alligator sinensis TaxID=38654 RepID=A0A3Q0FVX7_ALLSI|nr:C-type lectin lectoxin-Lio2-like [Alligator sinensis]
MGFAFPTKAAAGAPLALLPPLPALGAADTAGFLLSQAACRKQGRGAHLASVLSSSATEVVAGYISSHYPDGNVWIGLHDPRHNRVWTWTDGSSFTYRAWRFWEPNNWMWREYCVELRHFGGFKKWNDIDCKRQRAFICKYHLKAGVHQPLGR